MVEYKSILNNKFRFVPEQGEIFDLNITTDIKFSGEQAIVIYESASGNGGITINNGRLNELIPFNGFLVAQTNDALLKKCDTLMKIKEKGNNII